MENFSGTPENGKQKVKKKIPESNLIICRKFNKILIYLCR